MTSGRGWAAWDAEVDREDRLDGADDVLCGAEHVAAEGAVAERGDSARLGHGVVGDEQRRAHSARDRAGDEEHVGVARRGDDSEPEALEVVVGAGGEGELVLAAVARAGVDVADREAASAGRAAEARCRGGVGGGRGGGSASAIGAGVAELEALVDEREVREQVVDGGVGDGGPVRVRAGPQPEALDAVAASLHDAARRAAWALDAADADRSLLGGGAPRPPGSTGPSSSRSRRSKVCRSSSARCSNRARTSPTARLGTMGSRSS